MALKSYLSFDAAGNTTETYSYDVYGRPNTTGGLANPYFFTGRRLDAEICLYYYRARYYSPYIGRFLQTDTIGYADGLNWYVYCGNNPLNWIDPYGLCGEVGSGIGGRGFWDWAQDGLSAVGLFPAFGIFPDTINTGISAIRGNWGDVVINAGAMIPLGGQFVTGGKFVAAGAKYADNVADVGKAGQKVLREGVYEFTSKSGKKYAGQTSNFPRRIKQHLREEKLLPQDLNTIKTKEVLGGKTAREIAEQRRITELGGIDNLENVRNPLSKARRKKFGLE